MKLTKPQKRDLQIAAHARHGICYVTPPVGKTLQSLGLGSTIEDLIGYRFTINSEGRRVAAGLSNG